MADKLDWLGKHLVLLRHLSVADAIASEAYKIPPDVAELFEGVTGAADMVFKLAEHKKHKNACELLAYIAHRRAAVWWGYRCVNAINEELAQKPPEEIDFDHPPKIDLGLPELPHYEVPKPDPALVAAMDAQLATMDAHIERLSADVNPAMQKYVEDGVAEVFKKLAASQGVHPLDQLKTMGEGLPKAPYQIKQNPLLLQYAETLKATLKAKKAETLAQIESMLPAKSPAVLAHEKKLCDDALSAVYRWVVAPDSVNSQKCLDIGNECTGAPAGLLSLSAFWASGNLMPTGDQVIHTPPGLAANGIDKVLLMCAVQQGGTRKMLERYELYFQMGVDVLSGADNWAATLASKTPPHEKSVAPPHENQATGYKRWKPKSVGK
ncbi:MAG: hypothetical protein LBT01_05605 [Spirochaetaceae bacterium]|jgi:hypothetical protein|nr:hypothetical protein [Spirochaetaceae bacterium]